MTLAYNDAISHIDYDDVDDIVVPQISDAAYDREQRELRISLYAEQHEQNLEREERGEKPTPFYYLEDEPPNNVGSNSDRFTTFRLTPA